MSFLGKLAYKIVYKPQSFIDKIKKQGGIINSLKIEEGKKAMQKASKDLRCPAANSSDFQIHFLTGKKFWYQTAFCAYSLVQVVKKPIQFTFYDDGSFDINLINQAKSQFPGCIIHLTNEIDERLAKSLPADKFPILNHKRKIYPHIKKLTDVHCGLSGWKIVLDSDMLFFKYPKQMMEWLENPLTPFFILDIVNSYHYSFELMEKLTNNTIERNLNVGAIGLKSEIIDWDKVEEWIGIMEGQEGMSYYLEQALSAMIVSGMKLELGSKEEYVVLPKKEEILKPTRTLHHYVAESKEWYLKGAWKIILD